MYMSDILLSSFLYLHYYTITHKISIEIQTQNPYYNTTSQE